MKTKRSEEGVILIDHRNSPGISQEFIAANKLDVPAVGGGKTFESALYNCKHCGADVILNPNRSREREWCWSCDGYICDSCGAARKAGVKHRPMKQFLHDMYERVMRSKF